MFLDMGVPLGAAVGSSKWHKTSFSLHTLPFRRRQLTPVSGGAKAQAFVFPVITFLS